MTIRRRLTTLILLPTLVIYVLLLGLTLVYLEARSRSSVEREMTKLAANYAARFDGYLRELAGIAELAASAVQRDPYWTESRIFALLQSMVGQNPLVYGSCMAFEPGAFQKDESLFAPYVYRSPNGLVQMNITREVYDWYSDPKYTWFRAPKQTGRGVWSDPYFDEGAGNVLMATYSAPFFADGDFRGVTTVDIDLPRLQSNVGREFLDGSDFVIVTGGGQYVYSPDPKRIMKETIFDVAQELQRPDLDQLGRRIVSGKAGVASVNGWDTPDKQWVFFAPIASTGWAFASRLSEDAALEEVRSRMTVALAAAGSTLMLIVGCIFYTSGLITRPIGVLNAKVLEIAGGKLDARVDQVTSDDEIGQLARSFNQMTVDLQTHVSRLAQVQSAREKMERDLSIARDIQRSLLPVRTPDLPGFDVAGWSLPADQTGGDYYDWQALPGARLVVSLADVTGHGIGPALVTAVCRAYARASFQTDDGIGRVLDRLNSLLVEDLQGSRFVTFVVAVVDSAASRVQILSAGHGPLFIYHAAEDWIEELNAHDIPFGIDGSNNYGPPTTMTLRTGDTIVLITDGFFEWANGAGEQFGTERVCEIIRATKSEGAERIIAELYASVRNFSSGTPQLDDLTAVVLKRTSERFPRSSVN